MSTALGRARTAVLGILTLDVLVLAVTGVILFFWYSPDTPALWVEHYGIEERRHELTHAMAATHTAAAWAALPLAVAAGVLTALPHLRRGLAVGIGLVAVLLFGLFSGPLLPWEMLALRSVRVGTEADGYRLALDADRVRFVIVDGREVAQATFARWVVVHTVVIGLALAGLLTLAWRRPVGSGGEDAEPVALGIGDHDPGDVALADAGPSGAGAQ